MEPSFILIKNEFSVAAGQKIIKGPDYMNRIQGDKLIDAAQQAADHIRMEADRHYQATMEKCRQMEKEMDGTHRKAQQEGYQAGFTRAQNDYATQIHDALIDRAEMVAQLEYSLVDILIESLKSIIGDMGADKTVRGIATNALAKAGRAQYAKLRIHPDRVESVQAVLQNIKEDFEGLEWIELVADDKLQPEDCMLQTPAGILDFSLDTQLRILKERLYARVRKAGAQ